MKPSLFLATTGSVASRLAVKMIAEAKKSGFGEVIFHPSESSLAFLFESVARGEPRISRNGANSERTENLERKIRN